MSEIKQCKECESTESTRFHKLKGEKWNVIKRKDLIKATGLMIYIMAMFWHVGMAIIIIAYKNLILNVLYV